VIDQPGVTSVIPGARTVAQARANAAAAELPRLGETVRRAISDLYDRRVRPLVHPRW
jgi:aryl-alcohol dehydrogenase-like predicted oxidoreductase